jgi:hypothetical protein
MGFGLSAASRAGADRHGCRPACHSGLTNFGSVSTGPEAPVFFWGDGVNFWVTLFDVSQVARF